MSMEEICDADNTLLNLFKKAQLQYALPSSKDHPKYCNKNDVQPQKCEVLFAKNYECHYLVYVVYTEDEICEIQEKEACKWKNNSKEKDNIINILKLRESSFKFVLYVLNKCEIDNKGHHIINNY